MSRTLLNWLRVAHAIEKPTVKLQSPTGLDSDALIAEVEGIRGTKLAGTELWNSEKVKVTIRPTSSSVPNPILSAKSRLE